MLITDDFILKTQCGDVYNFINIPLEFDDGVYENIFSNKNNKTVGETLQHKKYSKFKDEVILKYSSDINRPLGDFLLQLKKNSDDYYKKFLNKYGDLIYSKFRILDSSFFEKKGVYIYKENGLIKYIGRCRDPIKKRINQGYGKITPKNCYIDGQVTNCHLNSEITKKRNGITLWLHEMIDDSEIIKLEKELINNYTPEWNIKK